MPRRCQNFSILQIINYYHSTHIIRFPWENFPCFRLPFENLTYISPCFFPMFHTPFTTRPSLYSSVPSPCFLSSENPPAYLYCLLTRTPYPLKLLFLKSPVYSLCVVL